MKLWMKIGIGLVACGFLMIIICAISAISISNKEIRLRNQITAKQQDNQNEFDNMFKKIKQTTQVAKYDRDSLLKIFTEHATARKIGGSNQLMTWVKESVPNVDNSTLKNLMNIITSSRDSWTMRQKEILDLKRAHDNVIDTFPSSLICGSRGKIEVVIVTSSKTKESFETGEDNDTDLGLE